MNEQITTGKFEKVQIINDWEYLTYRLHGKDLFDNDQIEAQWRDETITKHEVFSKPFHTSYYDHGKQYDVTTKKFYINVNFHGTELEVPIEKIKVRRV